MYFPYHVEQPLCDLFPCTSVLPLVSHVPTTDLAKMLRSEEFEMGVRKVLTAFLLIAFPFVFNYIFTWILFQITHLSNRTGRVPPDIPHAIPLIGNAFEFVFNPGRFIISAVSVSLCFPEGRT